MSVLSQYQFTLGTPCPFQTAYSMYAALLEQLPAPLAGRVHTDIPVSQYVWQDTWCVSLLGEEAVRLLTPTLERLETLPLHSGEIHITGRQLRQTGSIEELLSVPLPNSLRLTLRTPTAFKSGGAYQLLPTQRLLLQSLMLKWNGCFGAVCPIEDAGDGLEALAGGIVYRSVQLDTRAYPIKRAEIPGVIGTIRLENRLTGFHRQLAGALLAFGAYAGIGIKTTLGMGGLTIESK